RRDPWADQSDSCRARTSLRKTWGRLLRTAEAGCFGQEINYSRVHCLSRRRQEIQIAKAAFAYPIQHDARAVSREVGSECRLSDGCAKLRRGALTTRETNGTWATAAPACEVTSGWLPLVSGKIPKGCGQPLLGAPGALSFWRDIGI